MVILSAPLADGTRDENFFLTKPKTKANRTFTNPQQFFKRRQKAHEPNWPEHIENCLYLFRFSYPIYDHNTMIITLFGSLRFQYFIAK